VLIVDQQVEVAEKVLAENSADATIGGSNLAQVLDAG
jgi:hypothetical protein